MNNQTKCGAVSYNSTLQPKRCINVTPARYVQGQPGGNLPSGHTGDDAIENLLNGIYAKTAKAAANPIAESELVNEAAPSQDCKTEASGDGDKGTQSEDVTAVGGAQGAQENTGESVEDEEEGVGDDVASETNNSAMSSDARDEPEGDDSSTGGQEQSSDYPERPNGWLHEYLLIYCIIGRPSDSEDPDLKTARKTSGPPNRGGKRRSTGASSSDTDGDLDSTGSLGNLDSTAIRTFAGAGEIQSRSAVKRERAAIALNAQQEVFRQKRLNHSEKMLKAVEALTANSALRNQREEEAAARRLQREEEAAARNRKLAKIEDLKGQLGFLPENSPQYMAVRAAIVALYQTPDCAFIQPVASSATPAPAVAGPPVAVAAASAMGPPPNLPGFSGGGASSAGAAGSEGFAGEWGASV